MTRGDRSCLKALSQASKVSLRTDEKGTMQVQFLIDIDEDRKCFVDFRIVAESENEEGSTDDETGAQPNETIQF